MLRVFLIYEGHLFRGKKQNSGFHSGPKVIPIRSDAEEAGKLAWIVDVFFSFRSTIKIIKFEHFGVGILVGCLLQSKTNPQNKGYSWICSKFLQWNYNKLYTYTKRMQNFRFCPFCWCPQSIVVSHVLS